ncbi:MAG: SnoaL-like domain-containing protein [Allomuricauda sp.]
MDIKTLATEMDSIVAQGAIVEAVEKFFADDANTSDYNQVTTSGKAQMVEKMKGFADAIAKVNGIKHHRTIVDGNVTASEFALDFLMKGDNSICGHEIIRRIWNDEGQVIEEEYFNA